MEQSIGRTSINNHILNRARGRDFAIGYKCPIILARAQKKIKSVSRVNYHAIIKLSCPPQLIPNTSQCHNFSCSYSNGDGKAKLHKELYDKNISFSPRLMNILPVKSLQCLLNLRKVIKYPFSGFFAFKHVVIENIDIFFQLTRSYLRQ